MSMDYLNPWLKLQDALDTFFLIFSFARKCLKRLFCFLSSPLSTISIRGEKQGVGCGNSRLKTEVVEKQNTQGAARKSPTIVFGSGGDKRNLSPFYLSSTP